MKFIMIEVTLLKMMIPHRNKLHRVNKPPHVPVLPLDIVMLLLSSKIITIIKI